MQFQNCIAIDSDDSYYTNFEGIYGGIYLRKTVNVGGTAYPTAYNKWRGSIILNVKHDRDGAGSSGETMSWGYGATDWTIENSVF